MPRSTAPAHDRPYLSLPEASAMAGHHRSWAWRTVKEQGHLLGVQPVAITASKVVIPRRQFERVLGLGPEPTVADIAPDWFDQ